MSIIMSGIEKEEILLPNNQKVLIEYGVSEEDDPIPAPQDYLSDLNITSYRRVSLFDESGKLIGTKIEKNPHKVVAPIGVAIDL
ncbi:MAG: hypothetical protein FWH29_09520 [Methanobrevibacter sp.]|nr:hypothetical protein [Methanobrevibacter sp.]